MSREILEAMHALAVEKGIATDKLHDALEDALQSAYKKQPGAAKYARVELDEDTGDFRVYELIVPEELEDELLVEDDRRAGPHRRPRDGRGRSRPPSPRSTPRSSRSTATRSTSATSRPTTSAASPRRPPSR